MKFSKALAIVLLPLLLGVEGHAVVSEAGANARLGSYDTSGNAKDNREKFDMKGNTPEAQSLRASYSRAEIHYLSEVNRLVEESAADNSCSDVCRQILKAAQAALQLKVTNPLIQTVIPERLIHDIVVEQKAGSSLSGALEKSLNKNGLDSDKLRECSVTKDAAVCAPAFGKNENSYSATLELSKLESGLAFLRSDLDLRRAKVEAPAPPKPGFFSRILAKPSPSDITPVDYSSKDINALLVASKAIATIALSKSVADYKGTDSTVRAVNLAERYLVTANQMRNRNQDPRISDAIRNLNETVKLKNSGFVAEVSLDSADPKAKESLLQVMNSSLSDLNRFADVLNEEAKTTKNNLEAANALDNQLPRHMRNPFPDKRVARIRRQSAHGEIKAYFGTLLKMITQANRAGIMSAELKNQIESAFDRISPADKEVRSWKTDDVDYGPESKALAAFFENQN